MDKDRTTETREQGAEMDMTLREIVYEIERTESLVDNPGRYFAARVPAVNRLREHLQATPTDAVDVPRCLLGEIGMENLARKPGEPEYKSDPNSHYSRAIRGED